MKSKRGNRYAQAFVTAFHWYRVYPMEKKSKSHDGLSTMFTRDGVPNVLIMDNLKEQIIGDFRKKAEEADFWIRQTELYSPWSNAAEAAIRELKKGSARKMLRKQLPKRMWDYCMELEAYVQSHTANGHPHLKGEVPKTVMSGETADISSFAKHGWYDWIKLRDTTVSYPENKLVLGSYIGPSTDIGPAMTAKIIKANGQYTHCSTPSLLTQDEIESPEELSSRQEFETQI